MLSINDITPFQKTLIQWYDSHKRDLPWRETHNPYIIWVSEIILQQTQVVQGLDYFYRFITQFPSVSALANANIDTVLKYWQGLGYYSRAHNMHNAAKEIMAKHHGNFPTEYTAVRALKGIGDYTAAAICSFAYNQPYATVDGNVYRFLARYFGISTPIDSTNSKKEFAALAQQLLNLTHSGLHNQAMIEFGALQCVPRSPDCNNCPFKESCKAFAEDLVEILPVKEKRTKIRDRFFFYICIDDNGYTYLKKRSNDEIWKGLFEFPTIETPKRPMLENILKSEAFSEIVGKNYSIINQLPEIKHVLSHQHIYACGIHIRTNEQTDALHSCQRIRIADIHQFAVSRLTGKFLEKLGW
ncbi:MAG TPA: A/G-specific adenine glycosylase [Paludibacteraceae bacterium]|jgi:A/G-specific adenine glycosylase|nr:A/G-specific adenine glycosylase [Paludibacteraceae bacterium]HPW95390.1 A/G-specific adenine glycosylase [Paludibacteraceae bacterium]HQC03883.1 A/G-specific adenine glycosylase [Paludibacteraceae bacterium]